MASDSDIGLLLTVKLQSNPGDMPPPPGQKARGKKKSKSSHYRQEKKQGGKWDFLKPLKHHLFPTQPSGKHLARLWPPEAP